MTCQDFPPASSHSGSPDEFVVSFCSLKYSSAAASVQTFAGVMQGPLDVMAGAQTTLHVNVSGLLYVQKS